MILAQKMVRQDGVLLCQKGAELTEGLISMLKRLNFETIPIEEVSQESPEERAARIAGEVAALEQRFARVKSDPVLRALQAAFVRRLHEGD